MVRKALASKHLLEYLQNLSKYTLSYGLIIGQPADEKDYILHLARTPLNTTETPIKHEATTVSQIPESAIAEHAIHTTRMLPGGLYVLGIFIVTKESIFKPLHKKLLILLQQIQSRLGNNTWLYGNHANSNERLVLHFSQTTQEYDGRVLNINTGSINPVNFNFNNNKEPQWCQLECMFDFNDVMKPITTEQCSISLKNQLKTITGSLNTHLKHATFIFDDKICALQDTIDSKSTSKRSKKENIDLNEENIINVTLLLPTTSRRLHEAEIVDNAGSVRILGQIASTVWLNPQTTYEFAAKAIIEDIVRSFQARLSMHFDSLTEGESGVFNDTCSLHEPPRRVQIALPNGTVTLSDYLFPGEGSHEAQISFRDVLDVPLPQKHAVKDTEGQADLSAFYNDMSSRDSNELPLPSLPTDTNKFMYIVGAGVAVGVLIISLLIHFLREYNIL